MRYVRPILLLTIVAAGCTHSFGLLSGDAPWVRIVIGPDQAPPPLVVSEAVEFATAPTPQPPAHVAIIDVDGILVEQPAGDVIRVAENPVARIRNRLEAVALNPAISAVVLRINSPGGGVATIDGMWRELQDFRAKTHRPVVAWLAEVGTGGAYYLASAADTIVATPTTVVGGMGVVVNRHNLRELAALTGGGTARAGADPALDPKSNPADEQIALRPMVEELHARFRKVVLQGRPKLDPDDETLFDGRAFPAAKALERGLIDRVGYLDDAVAVARNLAERPDAQVIESPPILEPMFRGSISPDRSRLPLFLYLWQPDPAK